MSGGGVLVTGGAGYIGSHTCKLLAGAGIEPIVYDNLATGHRSSVRWGPLVEGDILDSERLAQTLGHYRPDTVIHFAASAYVDEGADVGAGTKVWHFSHVMRGARIGEKCVIGQNVNVDGGTVIGKNVKIQPTADD